MAAGIDWSTIKDIVKAQLDGINADFASALEILKLDPFSDTISSAIGDTVSTSIQGVALSLVSLFFVMQFCNEAMYLKIRTYEDAFKVMFKFFLAKALVDNSSGLMNLIYNVFNGLTLNISSETSSIMSSFTVSSIIKKPSEAGFLGLNYAFQLISAIPTLLIIRMAVWTISLILIGRLFEVIVYSMVAPIPLATMAGEGWSDSARTFLKGFAAVCLQSLIIIVMFNAFNGVSALMAGEESTKLSMAVSALALALGVAKSGQWARTAVGMG